jgi:zinc-ribbon domain/Predicted membrane protein (DUF2127)
MYCDSCGHQLNDNAQFCSVCGKQLAGPPLAPRAVVPLYGRVNRHLKTVGILWIIYAVLRLFETFWIFAVGRTFLPAFIEQITSGIEGWPAGFPLARLISHGLEVAGFIVAIFAVLQFIAGWGLLERRPWARILALVLAFLALLRFPFGTALGIYTLWVLLPSASEQEYEHLTASRATLASSPIAR